MAPEVREWTVPTSLRALLWWPGVSFVLVLLAPDLAAPAIALAGLLLVAIGAVAARLRRTAPGTTVAPARSSVRTA